MENNDLRKSCNTLLESLKKILELYKTTLPNIPHDPIMIGTKEKIKNFEERIAELEKH